MRNSLPTILVFLALFVPTPTLAQTPDVLIEVTLPRTDAKGGPVYQRAILTRPNENVETALLYFRGGHALARISSLEDKRRNFSLFIGPHTRAYFAAGIALVVMDCPTDQWFDPGATNRATNCLDEYRSSVTHADDVRTIMARLRDDYGIKRQFIMGHSKGTFSSRWLAVHLGSEIAGSIHSAALTMADTWGNGRSIPGIPYDRMAPPVLFVHHRDDACRLTPYGAIAKIAAANRADLMTVRGGLPKGEPCSTHYHGYTGREAEVAAALISWIATGKTTGMVGD